MDRKAIGQYFKNALNSEQDCEDEAGYIYCPISSGFLIAVIVVVYSEEHGVEKYYRHDEAVEPPIDSPLYCMITYTHSTSQRMPCRSL